MLDWVPLRRRNGSTHLYRRSWKGEILDEMGKRGLQRGDTALSVEDSRRIGGMIIVYLILTRVKNDREMFKKTQLELILEAKSKDAMVSKGVKK